MHHDPKLALQQLKQTNKRKQKQLEIPYNTMTKSPIVYRAFSVWLEDLNRRDEDQHIGKTHTCPMHRTTTATVLCNINSKTASHNMKIEHKEKSCKLRRKAARSLIIEGQRPVLCSCCLILAKPICAWASMINSLHTCDNVPCTDNFQPICSTVVVMMFSELIISNQSA